MPGFRQRDLMLAAVRALSDKICRGSHSSTAFARVSCPTFGFS